tara:strand:+ start:1184 stop:1567 length:384 start_codon:yes stop_codon:yes gene_type:complete
VALFITNRITDFETSHNPDAIFVHFDTSKGDSFGEDTSIIKSLSEDKRQAIIYRKNMSSEGAWSAEEFNKEGKATISSSFDLIRSLIINGRLVVFPIIPFSLAKSVSIDLVSDYMDKQYIQMVNTAS